MKGTVCSIRVDFIVGALAEGLPCSFDAADEWYHRYKTIPVSPEGCRPPDKEVDHRESYVGAHERGRG